MKESEQYTNPIKAIRAKCIDCCCGSKHEVELCPAQDCPLWHFRFGKNPYRAERSEAQIEAARKAGERLKAAQTAQKTP